jgi:hypothetical protein
MAYSVATISPIIAGLASQRRATRPEVCGLAIEVPL